MSYTPPTGVVAASWVGAAAYKGPVHVLFGRWAGGNYITPAGNNELAFGTPFITKQQFASPLGVDFLSFAPAFVARGTDYIPPFKDLDARWAGAAEYEPPAMPLGVVWASGPKESQYVFVEPIGALGMGEPAAIWPQTIAPVGVDDSVVGAPVVRPPPLNASWYGANEYTPPVLELWARWGAVLDGRVYANSWQSGVVGIGLSLRNHRARIDGAGSIPPANGYGSPSVWLYTRYLNPGGVGTQAHGSQWASHWLRYITATGAGDKTARGTPWVSRSPREVAPAGFDAMKVLESHVVGGTRFIEPVGTEMTEWGARIIPEGKVAYPQGFSGEVGLPDVQLHKRYLRPQQFQTNPDSLRFGRQDVWNLRQYICQDYDPNDGLNPPPFGQWTGIENRNKEPVPVGWLSERIGYQFVWNKASPMLPGGIEPPSDAPTYKAGSVTHWRRDVYPGGVNSFASERWHAVFNNADVLQAHGGLHQEFGHPALENRSRLYDKVGNFDSMAVGTPMVADAIRTLTFEPRYSIEPPTVELPRVGLYTRYIEGASVGDKAGAGSPVLDIRWTYIAPKWAFHPPAFIGEPALHNVTPELRTGGANHEEFGSAAIRTQWRRVETKDGDMTQWGRPIVRDRRHWVEFVTVGAPPNLMPGPKVTKVGGLPDPQGVQPPGIGPTPRIEHQVPTPVVGALMARVEGIDPLRFGTTVVTANSIRVEPGFWEPRIGELAVSAKNRALVVPEWGEAMVYQVSPARVSPHTVYAVVEAPEQAIKNHPWVERHYVDHNPKNNAPLTGVGEGVTVALRHRVISPSGFVRSSQTWDWPRPSVFLGTRYVAPSGLRTMYFGIPSVPGLQEVSFMEADTMFTQGVGVPSVAPPPYVGPITVKPAQIAAPVPPTPYVDFKNRSFRATGWHSLGMGRSHPDDRPYQWQSLHVGPLMPTIPEGFAAEVLGEPWVSLRVRDMPVQGFDAFECTHDVQNFDKRLRVTRTPTPRPPARTLAVAGFDALQSAAPDLRAGRHYIRPDGNAEQYRKGAPQ